MKGFTLVELMVAIAIVGILSIIGMLVYAGLNARARDSVRLSDLSNFRQAITLALNDVQDQQEVLCHDIPDPCQGQTYPSSPDTHRTDGSGWIKVNFDDKNVTFPQIPMDPLNNENFYYVYRSGNGHWKIEARLESGIFGELMEKDGGSRDDRYEVGSNLRVYN